MKELLEAVCRYQSEDGRWYQVVNKGGMKGNWLENSCSCLFVAAICKAVKKGILPEEYLEKARRGYEGVIRSLEWDGDDLLVGNVCIGTGVGDYRHYCERPVSINDLHGVGGLSADVCAGWRGCRAISPEHQQFQRMETGWASSKTAAAWRDCSARCSSSSASRS